MVVGTIQALLFLLIAVGVFAVQVWALVDASGRPARAFSVEGKRTKKFWTWLLVGAAVIGFLGLPPPIGIGLTSVFLTLISVVPAAVYLTDVKPAIRGYGRGGRGAGGRRPGGGW